MASRYRGGESPGVATLQAAWHRTAGEKLPMQRWRLEVVTFSLLLGQKLPSCGAMSSFGRFCGWD